MSPQGSNIRPNEGTPLLGSGSGGLWKSGHHEIQKAHSQTKVEEDSAAHLDAARRLKYNEYTTVDRLRGLVDDTIKRRQWFKHKGIRQWILDMSTVSSAWVAVILMGVCTAVIAFAVDKGEATVSDWKFGFCSRNVFLTRENCCRNSASSLSGFPGPKGDCNGWHPWSPDWWRMYAIYGGIAVAWGLISASVTRLSKRSFPGKVTGKCNAQLYPDVPHKTFIMAGGSGIPEIRTLLNGFEVPHFFDLQVLVLKPIGTVFATGTGMVLGKEGPFIHISACVGYSIARLFPKFRKSGRKFREVMSASIAAGIACAFGAPTGGVLFSFEEISSFFPHQVLWRAFLCAMSAGIVLRELDPTGSRKLDFFETDLSPYYRFYHYLAFLLIGIGGGLWGGVFCKVYQRYRKRLQSFEIIKNSPVSEAVLVAILTSIVQYPFPITRETGADVIKNLIVNCYKDKIDPNSYVCERESGMGSRGVYVALLAWGCVIKSVLLILTLGLKIPNGVIIPALSAGAFFGRLVGQAVPNLSPGAAATAGAAAFQAGVSRMTISLAVIMLEMTGEVNYVLPFMVAIFASKVTADAIHSESIYDLMQELLGHPFLDAHHSMRRVRMQDPPHLVERLIPAERTMQEVTVEVEKDNRVPRSILQQKLDQLVQRGLMDAGLVIVRNDMLQGYIGQAELTSGLAESIELHPSECRVRLLGDAPEKGQNRVRLGLNQFSSTNVQAESVEFGIDSAGASKAGPHAQNGLSLEHLVDRTPMTMCESAPIEYAIEVFGNLGLKHLIITEEGTGRMVGVCLKKRLLLYLDSLP